MINFALMQVLRWNLEKAEQMNPLVTRQAFHSDQMTVARLTVCKGAVVPEHHHANEQISMVIEGAFRFHLDGETQIISAGELVVIPANVPHSVEALEDSLVVDVFAPAREDWIRGDDGYLRR
jgi:quercetin dioxygenase-like cupin family protein